MACDIKAYFLPMLHIHYGSTGGLLSLALSLLWDLGYEASAFWKRERWRTSNQQLNAAAHNNVQFRTRTGHVTPPNHKGTRRCHPPMCPGGRNPELFGERH